MAENGNATDPPFNEADSPKKDKPQEKRELTREVGIVCLLVGWLLNVPSTG